MEREIQAKTLALQPLRAHELRLAFGKAVLGQLTDSELRVFDSRDFRLLSSHPLEGPRSLLSLADGALLAVGSRGMLRFDPETNKSMTLAKPVLLPGAELHADAIAADRVWVFDPTSRSADGVAQGTLQQVVLARAAGGLLLPSDDAQWALTPGGVLGRTREGVWLHAGDRRVERFAPGGARLSKLNVPPTSGLSWMLSARRLDQSYWVYTDKLVRVLVSPTFKELSSIPLSGSPLVAASGDEGRLLAMVVVTRPGPRFELQLFDAELKQTGRVELPAESPTGAEDWVKVVTRNQGLSVAARSGHVAVGGPDRVLVFDAAGKQIFSSASR